MPTSPGVTGSNSLFLLAQRVVDSKTHRGTIIAKDAKDFIPNTLLNYGRLNYRPMNYRPSKTTAWAAMASPLPMASHSSFVPALMLT